MELDGRCFRHGFEVADSTCRNCGLSFCSECLVFSFGANKPPYCISCALAAAGVRSNAAIQTNVNKRELKRLEKERKKAAKAKKSAKAPQVEVAASEAEVAGPPDAAEDNPFAWADDPDAGQRVPF